MFHVVKRGLHSHVLSGPDICHCFSTGNYCTHLLSSSFVICCCIPGTVRAQVLFICEKEKHTFISAKAIKTTIKLQPCCHHSYRCRWSHTICSKNGFLSNRMSKFAVCQRTVTQRHKYILILFWINHHRILQMHLSHHMPV